MDFNGFEDKKDNSAKIELPLGAANGGSTGAKTAPVVVIRRSFPETWIWAKTETK